MRRLFGLYSYLCRAKRQKVMIDTRFLSVFLSGIATAYFALSAYFLFRRKESSRLQIVVGCIFLQWTVLNLKDFIFTQYDASSQVLQDIVVLLDGTSLIGYTFLLCELIRPRWATWRKALGMLLVYIPFFILYAVWPSQTVINCYLVCLTIAGTVIFFVWLRQAYFMAENSSLVLCDLPTDMGCHFNHPHSSGRQSILRIFYHLMAVHFGAHFTSEACRYGVAIH